jgi:hypothetical protein
MMHEAEDEPLFAERAAGIDIAKAGIEVTVRVPSDTRRGGRQQETRSFRTTRKAGFPSKRGHCDLGDRACPRFVIAAM